MAWRGEVAASAPRQTLPGGAGAAALGRGAAVRRVSNGLKDFLWLLSDLERGCLLDLGPVSQATVSFFTERKFKVYTEDLLRSWKEFLRGEEQRLRGGPVGQVEAMEPAALAERFLATSLCHPDGTFDAVLMWDVLDYLDGELLPRVVNRLHGMVRPGGVVLGLFHSRPAQEFHRYRVHDAQTIEVLPAPRVASAQHTLQNREILELFELFSSSKTFVGRDQLREALLRK